MHSDEVVFVGLQRLIVLPRTRTLEHCEHIQYSTERYVANQYLKYHIQSDVCVCLCAMTCANLPAAPSCKACQHSSSNVKRLRTQPQTTDQECEGYSMYDDMYLANSPSQR